MLAVFATLFHSDRNGDYDGLLKKLDCVPVNVFSLSVGLLLLALDRGGIQYYALLSIPLLLLYSGKRGKRKMKYFFYIFYPLHLVIIYGIAMLMGGLNAI